MLARFCLTNGLVWVAIAVGFPVTAARADDQWIVFDGEGPGKGKHIVLVSGDEEYRSEEA